MSTLPAHNPERRPPTLDMFQLGVTVASLLATIRARFERPEELPDTSIAWEDGESAEEAERRR